MTGLCKYCGGPEHTDERELAVEVFVDRYRRSGMKTLHEFAGQEMVRQLEQARIDLPKMGRGDYVQSFAKVIVEGILEITLLAADHLRKHTQ
jgi:hypothetical protein